MAAAASKSLPFTIPKCIRRSKTAILKALSGTIGVDKTAPHYSFIDDPATIPTSMGDRRNYFLAKEFGRRAARQLAIEWPTLFMFDRDKPRLEAFRPEKLSSLVEAEKVDENSLRQLIDAKQVSGAVVVFERLRASDTKLSPVVIQDLFSLAAYFNAQDPPPTENEEWPGLRNFYEDPPSNISQSAELISLLYTMVEKNVANLSTMICWLCKHDDKASKKRALEMFNEAVAKKMILEEDAFISLILKSATIDEVNAFLTNMAHENLKPSIRTFNAALSAISKIENYDLKWKVAKQYVSEANRLGLELNLTTYYYVLKIVRPDNPLDERERSILSINCMAEVLTILETRKSIQCQQFTDQLFFDIAMSIAADSRNEAMLDRVDKLYRSKKNHVKLTAFTVESSFYGRYLSKKIGLMRNSADIEALYTSMVPRVVGVSRELISKMIYKLQKEKNWSLTKRVIEDGICARYVLDDELLKKFLQLLSTFETSEDKETDIIKQTEFEKIVVRITDFLLELSNFNEMDRYLYRKLNPMILGECAVLLLRTTQKAKGWAFLDMLVNPEKFEKQVKSDGYPHIQVLVEIFDHALLEDSLTNAANCLQLIKRHNPSHDINSLVEKLNSKFQLGNAQLQLLSSFSTK